MALRAAVDAETDLAKRDALLHEEWLRYLGSVTKARVNGRDPVNNVYPGSRAASPEVAESFIVPMLAERQGKMQAVNSRPEVRTAMRLFDTNLSAFKALNAQVLARVGPYATEGDIALAQSQMQKHEIPEEDRQRILFGLNEAIRLKTEIDPKYDIENDPDLKRIMDGISVDSGAGYFREGQVQEDPPLGGNVLPQGVQRVGYAGVRAAGEGMAAFSNNMMDLGLQVMAAASNDPYHKEQLDAFRAEAFAEPYVDSQGNYVSRAPRAQSITNGTYLAFKLATNGTIDGVRERAVALHDAETLQAMNERGDIEMASEAIAIGLGSLTAFVATGGGKLVQGGAQLVTRGKMGAALMLGAKEGTRLGKVAAFLRKGLGEGIGLGVYDATLYGRPDGYGKAFIHAVPMGLVFAAAGAMGKASEKMLAKRTKLPKMVRDAVSGGIEGFTLTAGNALDMEAALWRFMRDPSEESSSNLMREVLANSISFGIFKGMTGSSPFEAKMKAAVAKREQVRIEKAQERRSRASHREWKKTAKEFADKPTEPYRFRRMTKEDFDKAEAEPTELPTRKPTVLGGTDLFGDRPVTKVAEREPTVAPGRPATELPTGPYREPRAPTAGMPESPKGIMSFEKGRPRAGAEPREPTAVPARERSAQGERTRSAERLPQPRVDFTQKEMDALSPKVGADMELARRERAVQAEGHTVEDRVKLGDAIISRLDELDRMALSASLTNTAKNAKIRTRIRAEVRALKSALRKLKLGPRTPTQRPPSEATDVGQREPRAPTAGMPVSPKGKMSFERNRPPTKAPEREGAEPPLRQARAPTAGMPPGPGGRIASYEKRRPPTQSPIAGPTRLPGRDLFGDRPATKVDPREPSKVLRPEQIKRQAEQAERVKRVAKERTTAEAEAKRRVVNYDELTEIEKRSVEADRRKGKAKSFNQRMQQVAELTDPLERTDYLDLPQEVRDQIEAAPSANARKLIWFRHVAEGAGDRRVAEGERRQAGEVIRPGPALTPYQAGLVREALRRAGAEAIAGRIGTEPRVYTAGEVDQIAGAIRQRIFWLRREGTDLRNTDLDMRFGDTATQRVKTVSREIRKLREVLNIVQLAPVRVRRTEGLPAVQFEPQEAATMKRLLGEGSFAAVTGPHLEPDRRVVAEAVYEKIQELRNIELRSQLAGRESTLKKARQQIRDLLGVLRKLQSAGEQAMLEKAGVNDQPGMPDVPILRDSLRLDQMVEAYRQGEFDLRLQETTEIPTGEEPREETGVETFDEMVLRADVEGEIQPGTHEEMMVDRVQAKAALELADALGIQAPEPRMGQPKSLRLTPQNQLEEVTDREIPDLRRRDVMATIEGREQDPVQLAIREDMRLEGERLPEGTLGFFSPAESQARVRHSRATMEAVHESSHAMDTVLQLRGDWRPDGTVEMNPDLYRELAQAAWTYPGIKDAYFTTLEIDRVLDSGTFNGKKLTKDDVAKLQAVRKKLRHFVQSEGFAEFWARWRLEDPILEEEVPFLHDYMLNKLMPSLPPSFMEQNAHQRKVLADWRDIGARRRMRAGRIMETDQPTQIEKEFRGGTIQRAKEAFGRLMLDDLAEAKKAWERWLKASRATLEGTGKAPLPIPPTMNPLRALEAFRMTTYTQAQRMVHAGTHDIFGNRTGEALETILARVPKNQQVEFLDYWVAQRVKSIEKFARDKAYRQAYKAEMLRLKKEGATEEEAHPEADEAGKQAAEMAKIPETGFEMADVEFLIAETIAREDLNHEMFDDIIKQAREWSLRVIDYGVQAGSIKEADRNNVAMAYEVYLPFKRAIEGARGDKVEAIRPGVGVPTRAKALKGFSGSAWEIEDPLKAMRAQAFDVIHKAQQHIVKQALYLQMRVMNPRLVKHGQTAMGSFVSQVVRDAEPRTVFIDQIAKSLVKTVKQEGDPDKLDIARKIADDLIDLFEGDTAAAIQFWVPQATHVGTRPIVPFRPNVPESFMDEMSLTEGEKKRIRDEQDKPVWMEIDPVVFNALMTIDAPRPLLDQAPAALRNFVLMPSRAVRAGATVLSPAFVARNIVRDTMSATLFKTGKKNYGLFAAIADGIGAAVAQREALRAEKMLREGKDPGEISAEADEYQRFANLGLEGASIYGTEFQRDFKQSAGRVLQAIRRAADTWGALMARPEAWHRFAEFRDVRANKIAEGASSMDAQLDAMLAAKEVSTNFTRAGTVARAINQIVPYYAPNLAGKRKFYRVLSGKEGKEAQAAFFIRGLKAITGMSIAVYAFNMLTGDDDWREDLPEWQRLNYWNIKIPGTDVISKIPKPFELGQLFGTLPEALIDMVRFEHGDEMLKQTLDAYATEQRDAVGRFWQAAMVMPWVEVITNHSFFKDRPLTPEWLKASRMPRDQKTRYTTGTAEVLSSVFRALGMDINPIEAENLMSGYTGGLGLSFARGVDDLFSGDLARTLGAPLEFTSSFFGRTNRQGAYQDAIYGWSEELTRRSGSGDLEGKFAALRPRVEQVKRQITSIRNTVKDEDEANRRIYALAKPVIDQLGSMEP